MRRFSIALIGSVFFAASAFAAPAFAADAGTYRPGNSYNSVPANNADICELQCSGDAQCRSWNFIRVSRMSDGVCEFNENSAAPVPSEISTSGQNVSRRGSAQLIAGRTNTRRIGAPTRASGPASVTQRSPARRVVREAVPARVQPRAASYTSAPRPAVASAPAANYGRASAQNRQHLSLTEQQNMNRQRAAMRPAAPAIPQNQAYAAQPQPAFPAAPRQMFRHSLEEGAAAPQRRMPPAASYPNADPRLAQRVQQASVLAGQSGTVATPSNGPQAQTQAQAQAQAQAQFQAQRQAQLQANARAQAAAQRRVHIPSELSPRPMGAAEATESLFGSLYDDVKIPAQIDAAQITDPNAPIPTVSSVPSGHIMSAPLPPVR